MSEFYVGYLDKAPPRLGGWLRALVGALLGAALALGAGLASAQRTYAPAVFEFGTLRTLEGVWASWPAPALRVALPGGQSARVLLVGAGKHRADPAFDALDGHRVRVEGTLVYRHEQAMVELRGAPEDLGPATAAPPPEDYGEQTLIGEVVDSKCFLGVMNPGNLKPHRDCAVRCISGGIPPILLVREGGGLTRHVLLVGRSGEPIGAALLDRVAEPLEVRGHLQRLDGQWILRADPAELRRIE